MAEWKIRRRADACGACEHAFEEGERYASTLVIQEDEIAREDACASCWAERAPSDPDAESELFFWFTRHRADKKRTLNLDLAALEALFVSLGKRKETAARELRFVLCLLLMRKRRLKLEKVVRSSDGEAMLVRKPRHKDTVRVHVFDFTPERLAELKGELRDVFEGADPDAAPDATPDATPGDAPDAPIASEDGSAQAGEDASSSEPERGVDEAEKGPSADRSRGAEPGTELCESSASS